jgi:hypothetical protein
MVWGDEWQRENLKGAITLADSAIRSLILVNGAAGAALLTFYGNHPDILVDAIRHLAMRGSLISFGTGVFVATICSILAYLSQRAIATNSGFFWEGVFAVPAFVLALVSAGEFANGLYLASAAL